MRKIITIFIVTVFACSSLQAQDKKNRSAFGLKSGINCSSFRLDGTAASFWSDEWKTGFVAGFFVEIPAGKFSVQPEVLYSSMGSELKQAGGAIEKYRVNYLSIPVLGKFRLAEKFRIVAGPQVDFLIQAKRMDANDNGAKVTNDFKPSDIGLTAGLEYQLFKCLNITGRYIHGFTDVDRRSNLEARNQAIQLNVGVTL